MDGRRATGPHLSIPRLIAVMLDRAPVTEAESDHLAHCPECMQNMIDAVRKEIQGEKDKADGGQDVA